MTSPAPCLHFVGFRDDAFIRAVRVFGRPAFVHPAWDRRAAREIADGDVIVFATGDETQEPTRQNAPDFIEPDDPARRD